MPNFVRCRSRFVTRSRSVPSRIRLAVAAASLAVAISACSSVTDPVSRHSAARQLWEDHGPVSYTYTLMRDCFCVPEMRGPVDITVQDNAVVSRTYVNGGAPVAADNEHLFPKIDGLFDVVSDAIQRAVKPLAVDYDATLGYPKVIAIQMDQRPLDGGLTLTASDLRNAMFPLR